MAARDAARGDMVQQHIRPSLEQTRSVARRSVWAKQSTLLRDLTDTSRSMAWYSTATALAPVNPNLRKSRKVEVATHRLRLGFRSADEIFQDRDVEPSSHCTTPSPVPLLHYLLHCPRTADLRARPPPPGNELWRAAMVVRRACEVPDVLAPILRDAPPPR